jgi:hypothetical protein
LSRQKPKPPPKLGYISGDFDADVEALCADGSRTQDQVRGDVQEALNSFSQHPHPRGKAVVQHQESQPSREKVLFLSLLGNDWEVFKVRTIDTAHHKGQQGGFRFLLALHRNLGFIGLLRVYSKEDSENITCKDFLASFAATVHFVNHKIQATSDPQRPTG